MTRATVRLLSAKLGQCPSALGALLHLFFTTEDYHMSLPHHLT